MNFPLAARLRRILAASFAVHLLASPAGALPGDLDGDGAIAAADENLLRGLYGSLAGDTRFDAAADLDADGAVDVRDLALFGAAFGTTAAPDTTPPALLVTLNDIPDDMNDVLVVPPDGFQITLLTDTSGGSVLDTSSLSVTATLAMGALAPGSELAPQFTITPTRSVWEVPVGSELARTTHWLTVSVADLAGNVAQASYGYAVRDFAAGPPLGDLQTLFLDFDQDRSLGPEIDFLEDLREYGLSSALAPALEVQMRDRIVNEILERVHPFYGRNADGSPGADAANVVFQATLPTSTHSRLCVGGESQLGGAYLGAATLDVNNLNEASDECGLGSVFGVFPQAIDNLWGGDPEYLAAFGPLDADAGGTPVGEDPLDAMVLSASFDPQAASAAEVARWTDIENGIAAFAQVVATAIAHETGHLLGLVAHGPTPGGLYGGTIGAQTDHNVTPSGATPAQPFLMNAGGSFSFAEMSGRAGAAVPAFRPLGWAYLRDRVVLDASVTGLFPPPVIASVTPSTIQFTGSSAAITLQGDGFLATPTVELLAPGDPTPNPVLNVTWVDAQTVTGTVFSFLAPPAVYDVRLRNPDGQEFVLPAALEVLP